MSRETVCERAATGAIRRAAQKPGFSRALAVLIAGAYFMENLDATIIAPAAPAIADSLGVQPVQINVAMTAYLLTVAVLIPGSGWLSDRFGARGVFSPGHRAVHRCLHRLRGGADPDGADRLPGAAGRRRRDDGAGRPADRAADAPPRST